MTQGETPWAVSARTFLSRVLCSESFCVHSAALRTGPTGRVNLSYPLGASLYTTPLLDKSDKGSTA